MLFIGISMVASLLDYHLLVSIHKPLGILILILVVIRFVNRRIHPPPDFLASMSSLSVLRQPPPNSCCMP
jgi:cytochrome b561